MDSNEHHGIKETIENAIVERLKLLFEDSEKGRQVIEQIRDKVLAEEVTIDDIIKKFEIEKL